MRSELKLPRRRRDVSQAEIGGVAQGQAAPGRGGMGVLRPQGLPVHPQSKRDGLRWVTTRLDPVSRQTREEVLAVDLKAQMIVFLSSGVSRHLSSLKAVSFDRNGSGFLRFVFSHGSSRGRGAGQAPGGDSAWTAGDEEFLRPQSDEEAQSLVSLLGEQLRKYTAGAGVGSYHSRTALGSYSDTHSGMDEEPSTPVPQFSLHGSSFYPQDLAEAEEASVSSALHAPQLDARRAADHLFAAMDPKSSGWITPARFRDAMARFRATFPQSVAATPMSRRVATLLARLGAVIRASKTQLAEEWFRRVATATRGSVNGRAARSAAHFGVTAQELKEGIAQQVSERRRFDLSFDRKDAADLIVGACEAAGCRTDGPAHEARLSIGTLVVALAVAQAEGGNGRLVPGAPAHEDAGSWPSQHRELFTRMWRAMHARRLSVDGLFDLLDRPTKGKLDRAKVELGLGRLLELPKLQITPHPPGFSRNLPESPISDVTATPTAKDLLTPTNSVWSHTEFGGKVAAMENRSFLAHDQVQPRDGVVRSEAARGSRDPIRAVHGIGPHGILEESDRKDPSALSIENLTHHERFPLVAALFGDQFVQAQEPELRAELITRTGSIPPHLQDRAAYLVALEKLLQRELSEGLASEAELSPDPGSYADSEHVPPSGGVPASRTAVPPSGSGGVAGEIHEELGATVDVLEDFSGDAEVLESSLSSSHALGTRSFGGGGSGGTGSMRLPNAANWIRRMVSKRKKRFQADGFDLDLSYVTPRVIAMGYPSTGSDSLYRNRGADVARFLNSRHGANFWVFDLCAERSYPASLFGGRVSRYPFTDHSPPKLHMMACLCSEVEDWLSRDESYVVAIHCKAGKGRTGVMVSAWLLWSGLSSTANDAACKFGEGRTMDGEGVTIPSQRRFIQYFEELLRFQTSSTSAGELAPTQSVEEEGSHTAAWSHSTRGHPAGSTDAARRRIFTGDEGREGVDWLGEVEGGEDGPLLADSDWGRPAYTEERRRALTKRGLRACLEAASLRPPDVFLPLAKGGAKLRFPRPMPIAVTSIVLSATPNLSGGFTPVFELACSGAHEAIRYVSSEFFPRATYQRGDHEIHFNVPRCALVNEFRIKFSHLGRTKRSRVFEFTMHTGFLPASGLVHLTKADIDKASKDRSCSVFPEDFFVEVAYEFVAPSAEGTLIGAAAAPPLAPPSAAEAASSSSYASSTMTWELAGRGGVH